jgi:hypothetical protein
MAAIARQPNRGVCEALQHRLAASALARLRVMRLQAGSPNQVCRACLSPSAGLGVSVSAAQAT